MPVMQFHFVASRYPAEAVTALLEQASAFYAAALYPELERPPVERVRAFVSDVAPDLWATGGMTVAQGAAAAPYFTCLSLTGRPPEQHQRMMAGLTELVARHLGCEVAQVRGRLIEIEPGHWFIGGAPASQTRAAEIAARRDGRGG